MRKIFFVWFLSILFISSTLFSRDFITIGTGGVTGVYYPLGGSICKIINDNKKQYNIKCSVESTGGSIYNANVMKNEELDLAFLQSDVSYQAYNGEGVFKGKPYKNLRSLMALYPEMLMLVVRNDSNITKLTDINGKIINIGDPGSGTLFSVDVLFSVTDAISRDKLKLAQTLKPSEGPTALKDGKIDGFFLFYGSPNANVEEAANSVAINLINIDSNSLRDVEKIFTRYPYYVPTIIPKGTYKGVNHDTVSFGTMAVLSTDARVSDKIITSVIKSLLDNFDELKKSHPSLNNITKKDLVTGLTSPLHPAAKKYYQSIGLISKDTNDSN